MNTFVVIGLLLLVLPVVAILVGGLLQVWEERRDRRRYESSEAELRYMQQRESIRKERRAVHEGDHKRVFHWDCPYCRMESKWEGK